MLLALELLLYAVAIAVVVIVAALAVALAVGVALRIVYPLPPLEPRRASHALRDTGDTPIGRFAATASAAHPGLSGIHLLSDPHDAFAARVALIRAAIRCLDVQYYIWHGDVTGTLMIEELRAAADRGVRVRLLLDDNGVAGLDAVLAALDDHPHVEVRLYNPFVLRRPKLVGYLADFARLNRRMHNKSLTADSRATVIGGRNIGDEYFGATGGAFFADLDILAIGPVVADVSDDFDRYWSSPSAYPAERLLPPVEATELAAILGRQRTAERDATARKYRAAVERAGFQEKLESGQLPCDWAPTKLVSDDPAKTVGRAARNGLLAARLMETIGAPRVGLFLVSAYFVPGRTGVDVFGGMSGAGVDIRVVTNSFESTDVWIVHAGYAKRRKALLRSGVRLFEMRRAREDETRAPNRKLLGIGSGSGLSGSGSGSGSGGDGHVLRGSASMLHAKTFVADDERVFVGSFNFDQRSLELNTELGFVVESPDLAAFMRGQLETAVAESTYELVLTGSGEINWLERRDGTTFAHRREPSTSLAQRVGIGILSRLPIEWML